MSFDRFKVDAPMSRLDEVEARIISADGAYHDGAWIGPESLRHLARTLAAEVDELRGKLDDVRMGIGCARGQRSTQYCAEAAARDEVITELLEMMKPGEMPKYCSFDFQRQYRELYKEWQWKTALHARACEIAGRTE